MGTPQDRSSEGLCDRWSAVNRAVLFWGAFGLGICWGWILAVLLGGVA